ncbi:MAG: GNAT family N-acetyltransferase [Holophaga sp.]|nr:GNAT family N-acetyltransferase [Holophaga sp.]
MSIGFCIRDYQEADFHGIARLWELTGLGSPNRGDDAVVIARTLAHGGVFLVMEAIPSGHVIGTSWMTSDGRRIYLHHFGIAPDYQNEGLGKALLETSLQRAGAMGLQIKLEVHRNNTAAIALYQKYGFTYLGDYDGYIIRDLNRTVPKL